MRPFRFGLQCREPLEQGAWGEMARRAEGLGWSVLTVADHLDAGPAPMPALVAAADATTTLRLGTMVLANDYRHPVVCAKEAATVDLLSGGRFELGIGAGWMTTDYEQSGIVLDRPSVRITRLSEAIDVIRGLWGDGPLDFAGEHYRIAGMEGLPKPAQPGGPPIVVGGGGEKVLRLAAAKADIIGLNVNLDAGVIDERAFPNGVPAVTDRKLAWIRDAAGDRFEDLELQIRVHLAMVTDDREAVIEELAPAFGLSPDDARQTPHALIGTVDEICDQLLERRERWNISYLGLSQDQLDPFAPVIARLAGS